MNNEQKPEPIPVGKIDPNQMKEAIEKAKTVTDQHQLQSTILDAPGEFNLYTLYMYIVQSCAK